VSNHFHLLLKPGSGQSISRILQSLTVAHTWRYHKQHRSSGHVWQGRFRSPVIQDDDHLLVVLRCIKANPVRPGSIVGLVARFRHPDVMVGERRMEPGVRNLLHVALQAVSGRTDRTGRSERRTRLDGRREGGG
jgi:hypothetical protein